MQSLVKHRVALVATALMIAAATATAQDTTRTTGTTG